MEKCEKCGKPIVKKNLEKCVNTICDTTIDAIGKAKEKLNGAIDKLDA